MLNKHHLDYKQSEVDNGIKALHKKYQAQVDENGREPSWCIHPYIQI